MAKEPPKKRLARWIKKLSSDEETWQPRDAPYPRLLAADVPMAALQGQSGVYAIWHLGVRPQWLRVRAAQDLASAIAAAKSHAPILTFQPNGGLYVSWMLAAAERAPGLAATLIGQLRPVAQEPALGGDLPAAGPPKPLACQPPPGTEQPAEVAGR